jgi:hypothetical protein
MPDNYEKPVPIRYSNNAIIMKECMKGFDEEGFLDWFFQKSSFTAIGDQYISMYMLERAHQRARDLLKKK